MTSEETMTISLTSLGRALVAVGYCGAYHAETGEPMPLDMGLSFECWRIRVYRHGQRKIAIKYGYEGV